MIANKILDHFCRCKNCGQKKENHKSRTNNCPIGPRTRIGFLHFQESCFFEPAKSSKKKENAINKMNELYKIYGNKIAMIDWNNFSNVKTEEALETCRKIKNSLKQNEIVLLIRLLVPIL